MAICDNLEQKYTHSSLTSGSGEMFLTKHCKLTESLASNLYVKSIDFSGSSRNEINVSTILATFVEKYYQLFAFLLTVYLILEKFERYMYNFRYHSKEES